MSTEEARDPTSNDEVRQAYRQLVHARQQYRRAAATEFEDTAHERFHDAAFDLYDELRARLKRRDVTDELWNEAKLWPVEPIYHDAAFCHNCGLYVSVDELEDADVDVGDLCPNCSSQVLEVETLQETDDEGQVVWSHVEGLKHLDQFRNRVSERTVEYSDGLGSYEKTVREQQLLAPQRLEAVADRLGEAMEVLGLFPDATSSQSFDTDEIR